MKHKSYYNLPTIFSPIRLFVNCNTPQYPAANENKNRNVCTWPEELKGVFRENALLACIKNDMAAIVLTRNVVCTGQKVDLHVSCRNFLFALVCIKKCCEFVVFANSFIEVYPVTNAINC